MIFRTLILTTFLFSTALQAQNSVGLNVNSKDFELFTSLEISPLSDYASGTLYYADVNYLHADGDNMTSIGFRAENTLNHNQNLSLSFGIKGVIADGFLAFPLTFRGSYLLPFNASIPSTSIAMDLSYAPEVLAINEAKSYADTKIEATMEIVPNTHLFVGYRYISTEYQEDDKTFNNSVYGGLKLSF
ncbi:MAG: YfaZ family outer membrane protein [Campylobacterota bacterium]|nr:YfaZ family outer membrane protein [Campylobacterota bacterium]